ncbi:MAG: polymer-forming cytoskeletal protein [Acidobacteria bacterium]|nr:polymer-forming cytoskeletal protein [Acidobacteriota bacterium]
MAFLFKKKKEETPTLSEIGENSVFDGELNSKNLIVINGSFKGICKSEKAIETREKSAINGKIHSAIILIKGRIVGQLEALEKIEIKHSAEVNGEMKSKLLKIEKGAVINGKIL